MPILDASKSSVLVHRFVRTSHTTQHLHLHPLMTSTPLATLNRPIDTSVANGEAWSIGRVLRVGNDLFDVLFNPPTVESIRLPGWPMAGFPIMPTYSMAFAGEVWMWPAVWRSSCLLPYSCSKTPVLVAQRDGTLTHVHFRSKTCYFLHLRMPCR